jgi:hypothetical protein
VGFRDIVRNGLKTVDKVTSDLHSTILHEAWISNDTYGKPQYALPVRVKGILEVEQRLRRLDSGQEVLQHAVITFPRPLKVNGATGRREPIDPRDVLTLPSGYSGPILFVGGVVDPSTGRPYGLEVILG